MSNPMHIADTVTSWLHAHTPFKGWTLCGVWMAPRNMASTPDAPNCPECVRKAGWNQ